MNLQSVALIYYQVDHVSAIPEGREIYSTLRNHISKITPPVAVPTPDEPIEDVMEIGVR
jgi:hypothetical protein